jgi:hypothetical protein
MSVFPKNGQRDGPESSPQLFCGDSQNRADSRFCANAAVAVLWIKLRLVITIAA